MSVCVLILLCSVLFCSVLLDNMVAMTLAPLFLVVLIAITALGHYALAGGLSKTTSAKQGIQLKERILGRYFILILFVTYFVLPRCVEGL